MCSAAEKRVDMLTSWRMYIDSISPFMDGDFGRIDF
jgi:hypothetical protein